MVIAVDFDGTIVKEAWPKIGKLRFGARWVLRHLAKRGHILILNTCREDKLLHEAVYFLFCHGIRFHRENNNDFGRIRLYGSDCRKISADLYIDDRAMGYWNWPMVWVTALWMEWREKSRKYSLQTERRPLRKVFRSILAGIFQ